jgi:hypothetical protein
MPGLGRCFHKHDVEFIGPLRSLFHSDLPTKALGTKGARGEDGSYRLSERSALFPTRTMMTSVPLSERTSSIHLLVDMKEARSGMKRLIQPIQAPTMAKRRLTGNVIDNNGHR